jgi:long-chain fatty acid transport protein
MRRAVSGLSIALALFISARSQANALELFGFDPRAVGMGGAQTAAAADYTAAFYNPSLLVLRKDVMIGVGFGWAQPVLSVKAVAPGTEGKLNAQKAPDFGGVTIGALFPLGGKVQNRVALGFGLYSPSNNLLRVEAIEPTFPAWYQYQSNPNRIVIASGVGVRLADFLLLGVGAQFLANFGGGVDFKLDLFSKEFKKRQLRNDLNTQVAPIAGLTFHAESIGLKVCVSYRAQLKLDFELPTSIDLGDLGVLGLDIRGVAHFSPHTFSSGVEFSKDNLTLTADVRYALWSSAPNPAVSVAVDLKGDVAESLGLAKALATKTDDVNPGFVDTLTPHVGLEYRITERVAVRGGGFFRPTPVPLQNEDTNILDGNTLGIAGGIGALFDDPLEVFSKPLQIHFALQRLFVTERTAEKGKSNPVPSYTYGGHLNSMAVAVRNEF